MNRRERRLQKKRDGARGAGAAPAALQRKATSLYEAGRFAEALRVCRELLAAAPDRPDIHGFAGMTALKAGEHAEAVKHYRRAVALRPDYAEAHYNLGNALKYLGRLDEAAQAYLTAAGIRPDLAPAHHNLGNVWQSLERYEDAAAAYYRALEIMPEAVESRRNLGIALQKLGRIDDAETAFRRAIEIKPDWLPLYNNLTTALLEKNEPAAAVVVCDEWLGRAPANTEALAFKCVALNEAGDYSRLGELLDFERFVHETRVQRPAGYDDLAAFNAALAAHVCSHPTLKVPPENAPTYHHPKLQITEELLVEPKGPMAELEQAMHGAVEDYRRAVSGGREHPFVDAWPARWRLTSWSVVLNGQGNLVPHIHLDGYLGGVYYVELPEVIDAGVDDDEGRRPGWLEIGRSPMEVQNVAAPHMRAIKPEEGLMLLFPSYFYHDTVPFESTQRRISIAFDLVPEG